MGTAFQLTSAQARKLGISIEIERTNKPRKKRTPEEKIIQERIEQAITFVNDIASLCWQHGGWYVDLCRYLSDDPRNEDYASIKDSEATPNAVVIWRTGVVRRLCWLWEIDEISQEKIVEVLCEE